MAICESSLEKCLIVSLDLLKIRLPWDFCFLLLNWQVSLYILDIYNLSDNNLQIFVSHSLGGLYPAHYISWAKAFWVWCSLSCLLLFMPLVSYQWDHCQNQYHENFPLYFLLDCYNFLSLMFKYLSNFEWIFVYGIR